MEKFNRAVRRHHDARLKKARQFYWGLGKGVRYRPVATARQLGMLVSTPAICSCGLCGCDRRSAGPTVQELRLFQSLLQEVYMSRITAQELVEEIDEFFGDDSRSRAATRSGLEKARDHIDDLLMTLNDEEHDEEDAGDDDDSDEDEDDA